MLIAGLIASLALLLGQLIEHLKRKIEERRQREWWSARYGHRYYVS